MNNSLSEQKKVIYEIRDASPNDVPHILNLLSHYAAMGDLLPRNKTDLVKNLMHFRVISEGENILACGSLEHFSDDLAEIRSLMVREESKGLGLGKKIVEGLIAIAKERDVHRVMALTYVPNFFHTMGFETVNKDIFPEKIWGICVNCYKFLNCDEIAVLLKLK